jgi:hypothetical protein
MAHLGARNKASHLMLHHSLQQLLIQLVATLAVEGIGPSLIHQVEGAESHAFCTPFEWSVRGRNAHVPITAPDVLPTAQA